MRANMRDFASANPRGLRLYVQCSWGAAVPCCQHVLAALVCLRCATQGHRAWPRRAQAGACSPRSRTKTRNRAAPYLVRWAAAAVTDCSCHSPRRQQLKNTVTRCRGCECEVVHTSRRSGPLKSAIATSIWRLEGYMAPKPKPARFIFTVGMALAMALTILTITADRDLAAPSSSAVYHPQLLVLY